MHIWLHGPKPSQRRYPPLPSLSGKQDRRTIDSFNNTTHTRLPHSLLHQHIRSSDPKGERNRSGRSGRLRFKPPSTTSPSLSRFSPANQEEDAKRTVPLSPCRWHLRLPKAQLWDGICWGGRGRRGKERGLDTSWASRTARRKKAALPYLFGARLRSLDHDSSLRDRAGWARVGGFFGAAGRSLEDGMSISSQCPSPRKGQARRPASTAVPRCSPRRPSCALLTCLWIPLGFLHKRSRARGLELSGRPLVAQAEFSGMAKASDRHHEGRWGGGGRRRRSEGSKNNKALAASKVMERSGTRHESPQLQ
ncbi:Hypothetical predicted protein [Podarcis lilfordi]|uniref:Uncharacterized protein n=1 Tax=Podarcis lilfordi TaxID=74358 RepID=A0AA35K6B7_9SAUR|nr:Hypothetical predicted protein [Podarcis lilfordi]